MLGFLRDAHLENSLERREQRVAFKVVRNIVVASQGPGKE